MLGLNGLSTRIYLNAKYFIMRELINIIESYSVLMEKSRGLLFRAAGDRFFKGDRANPESAILFDRAEYYPQQPGNYDTHEEMMQAYQQLEKKYHNLHAANKPTAANKAFAVLIFSDEKTRAPVYFARFFNTIKPDMAGTWKNSDLKTALGYQLEKETSLKASYNMKPSNIFPEPARFKNVYELLKAFKRAESVKAFVPGFEMLYGQPPQYPVFERAAEYYTAIRDDLGETIGPVALIQGLDCGTGAKAAARDLLRGGDYSGSSISFPAGKTNGLVDSYIVTPTGVEIGISSKGEKGATASIKNIADGIAHVRGPKGSDEQKKLLKKYSKQVQLIERIGTATVIDFPLEYAMENNMLSEAGATAIKELINSGAKSLDQVELDENTAVELTNLIGYKGAKTELPNYNIGYHALAAIAEIVADTINGDPKFGEACLKFLNSSPIIQLHLTASKQKDGDVSVTGLTSKYPPNFKGTVELDTSKNYSATSAGGRMNFAYAGKDAGLSDVDDTTSSKPTPTAAQARTSITQVLQPKPRPNSEPKQSGNPGREKRRR